nr:hypothetical protein Iba_chr02dCG5410 [Ipomoea batatas]GMC94253.1 hypothetical protein Iba_scaffold65173CG0010 [Ipomoea batatas]GMD33638.1 hypothetical protein Iba_scaffold44066CG0020 [Ipomoea batatas]
MVEAKSAWNARGLLAYSETMLTLASSSASKTGINVSTVAAFACKAGYKSIQIVERAGEIGFSYGMTSRGGISSSQLHCPRWTSHGCRGITRSYRQYISTRYNTGTRFL